MKLSVQRKLIAQVWAPDLQQFYNQKQTVKQSHANVGHTNNRKATVIFKVFRQSHVVISGGKIFRISIHKSMSPITQTKVKRNFSFQCNHVIDTTEKGNLAFSSMEISLRQMLHHKQWRHLFKDFSHLSIPITSNAFMKMITIAINSWSTCFIAL